MKKDIPDDKYDLIVERIGDIKEFVVNFKNDAEKKIDHSRTIQQAEGRETRAFIKDEISKIDNRLERLENNNAKLDRHDYQISEMQGDINSLGDKIEEHLQYHIDNLPEQSINKFKLGVIWAAVGIIGTGIFGVITGLFGKIFNFISNIGQ